MQSFLLNGNEWQKKERLSRRGRDEAIAIPPGQSFGSGTFFNIKITS